MAYSIGKIKVARTTIAGPGDQVDDPVVITETLDTNKYNDITSISNWDEYGLRISTLDITRAGIKLLYDSIGWSSLSDDEKKICSKFFVASVIERNSVLSDVEQKYNAEDLFIMKNKENNITKYGDSIYDKEPSDIDNKLINTNNNFPKYKEFFDSFSPSVINTWHTATLNVEPNSIVLVSIDSSANRKVGGVREVGSTIDRTRTIDSNSMFSVPVKTDSNSQIEIYADNGSITFYLTAQIG
jgi:hypothetical protein